MGTNGDRDKTGGKAKKAGKARQFIRARETAGPRRYVVRRSSIHNRGVFAACDIEPGQRIIQYAGEKITKAEAERRADRTWDRAQLTGGGAVYLFILNSRYDIDGAFPWNTARLINHSCEPNCEVDIAKGEIWIEAVRPIAEGEELTFNYGFDLEDYANHPCRCGTRSCVGFIAGAEYWPELGKLLKKERKAKKKKRAKKEKQAGKKRRAS